MATPVLHLDKQTRDLTPDGVLELFDGVRALSERLVEPLSEEDACVQSMPDASPAKWHLAHVTWFFETFVLERHEAAFRPYHPEFRYLFNSYYNGIGEQYPRPDRGLITRPGLGEVLDYRHSVDARMRALVAAAEPALLATIELGLHHEQQHQELLLMDVKHLLSRNPMFPPYRHCTAADETPARPLAWQDFEGGLVEIGHGPFAFRYDNETPRHKVWLEPYALASRPVTNGEYLEFIEDGAYATPTLWLADGWACVREHAWQAPAYWHREDDTWHEFTLGGLEPLDLAAPVCHVSHYEADAYAQWAGARLPSEFEWEAAAAPLPVTGNFMDTGCLHPRAAGAPAADPLEQVFGDVWEWTRSAYTPYPGFRAAEGAVGEYNGKFMSNQLVLKGGCCVTPPEHTRASYRNFFYPHQRWQFSGLRLARDA